MAVITAIATAIGTAVITSVGIAAGTVWFGVSAAALVGGIIVSGALYAAQSLLAPKQRRLQPSQQQYQAVLNQPVGARVRGYGRVKLGGTRAFYDSKDGKFYQLIMIHSGEISSVSELYLGDKPVTLDAQGNVIDGAQAGYASFYIARGTGNQAAWPALVSAYPGLWTSDHQLKGIAYVGVIFTLPPAEKFQTVFPEGYNTPVRVVCNLSKVLDPRTGVTAWSDNPALCIRDYLVSPDGYRLTDNDIDLPSFIAMANRCDEQIPIAAGGFEKRYRLGGVYNLNESPTSVLADMAAACDGEFFETAEGKISIRGGAWDAPTVTITDRDILSFDISQGNDAFAAFNQLKIVFTSPDHDYQATEAEAWDDLEDQALRGVVSDDLTLDMVQSFSQARRLAKIHRAKRNPQWVGTISTNLVGLRARGERIIRVVISELGIDHDFFVTAHAIRGDLTGCELGISSIEASAYDWTVAEEGEKPPLPPSTESESALPVPTGLLPIVQTRQITAGSIASVIVATVDIPSRADLQLEAQIKLQSELVWESMPVATGSYSATSGVLIDGSVYVVRARFRNSGAVGEWTANEAITVTANPVAPAAPASFAASVSGVNVNLSWVNPATNFTRARVFRSASNNFAGSVNIANVSGLAGQPSAFQDQPGTGTKYYWVVALNESNVSSVASGPIPATVI